MLLLNLILPWAFVLIGPQRPWNVQPTSYKGEAGWIALECRPGERMRNDPWSVNRIGLDGYVQPFPAGRPVAEKFSVVFGQHTRAQASGQWLNFHEIHALAVPGDAGQAGPLVFSQEWSNGAKTNVFRIWRRSPVWSATGKLAGTTMSILYESDLREGIRYDFAVAFREDRQNGYVRVSLNGVEVVNYKGQFGYGGGLRLLYPEFRIYRSARSHIARETLKIEAITVS